MNEVTLKQKDPKIKITVQGPILNFNILSKHEMKMFVFIAWLIWKTKIQWYLINNLLE